MIAMLFEVLTDNLSSVRHRAADWRIRAGTERFGALAHRAAQFQHCG
jgi:hypothetical protein